MMKLHARALATSAVIDRFQPKPFSWKTRGNCAHLAVAQARAMGARLPSVPRFESHAGAVRALRRMGFDTLEALLDRHLRRIPPAMLIVGDLAMLPGAAPFGALTVATGGAHLIGWHEADLSKMHSFAISKTDIVAAWAVGR